MKVEYTLKEPIEKIFKEILKNISEKLLVKKIFRSANDYSNYIILNPSTSPEILFEEEYEKEISDCSENNFAMYGNLEYENKNLHYLKIFLEKELIYEIYGYENFDENKFSITVKYKENSNEAKSEIFDIIERIIRNYTLFKF